VATRQHHKGRKRPRGWHRGQAAGVTQAKALDRVEQAERRGRTASDELRAVAARHNEDVEVWQAMQRAAPFVPRIEAAL
jgi:hypothetical protein